MNSSFIVRLAFALALLLGAGSQFGCATHNPAWGGGSPMVGIPSVKEWSITDHTGPEAETFEQGFHYLVLFDRPAGSAWMHIRALGDYTPIQTLDMENLEGTDYWYIKVDQVDLRKFAVDVWAGSSITGYPGRTTWLVNKKTESFHRAKLLNHTEDEPEALRVADKELLEKDKKEPGSF